MDWAEVMVLFGVIGVHNLNLVIEEGLSVGRGGVIELSVAIIGELFALPPVKYQ